GVDAARADDDGRGAAEANDVRRAFLDVGNSVIVLVGVGRAEVRGCGIEHDPTGDVAGNPNRRAALQEVVGVELRRVCRRGGRAIAGNTDRILDGDRPADIAVERDADRIAALNLDAP